MVGLASGNIQSFTTTKTLLNTIKPNDALARKAEKTGFAALFDRSETKPTSAPTGHAASADVSRQVRTGFLDWSKSVNGPAADQLAAAMQPYDFVEIYDGIVRDFGLTANDTADAYTAYSLLNWMMANKAGDPSRADVMAVRSQIRQSLAENAAFLKMSEAGRQEMAEVFIYNFVVRHGAYFGAVRRGDNGLIGRLSDAAQTRFRDETGVDLRRTRLTTAGFRPKTKFMP